MNIPNLISALPVFFIAWPNDATLTLIQLRRQYQGQFATSRLRDQGVFWAQISQGVIAQHPGFRPTPQQCRSKWNNLKVDFRVIFICNRSLTYLLMFWLCYLQLFEVGVWEPRPFNEREPPSVSHTHANHTGRNIFWRVIRPVLVDRT